MQWLFHWAALTADDPADRPGPEFPPRAGRRPVRRPPARVRTDALRASASQLALLPGPRGATAASLPPQAAVSVVVAPLPRGTGGCHGGSTGSATRRGGPSVGPGGAGHTAVRIRGGGSGRLPADCATGQAGATYRTRGVEGGGGRGSTRGSSWNTRRGQSARRSRRPARPWRRQARRLRRQAGSSRKQARYSRKQARRWRRPARRSPADPLGDFPQAGATDRPASHQARRRRLLARGGGPAAACVARPAVGARAPLGAPARPGCGGAGGRWPCRWP